ncbi:MAG: hypothetical protein JWO94_993 [Verrucomicrobiaceae bacterium]|nr:hypothetical protein [Verrucomicrobiaceae bacterium]
MKTSLVLLLSCLSMGRLFSEPPAKAEPAPYRPASAEATANLYGKTLSSLGDIVTVHIGVKVTPWDKTPSPHNQVWPLIEEGRLQDLRTLGTTLVPPVFSLEYSNGIRVSASRYLVDLTFPDGTTARYILSKSDKN